MKDYVEPVLDVERLEIDVIVAHRFVRVWGEVDHCCEVEPMRETSEMAHHKNGV